MNASDDIRDETGGGHDGCDGGDCGVGKVVVVIFVWGD